MLLSAIHERLSNFSKETINNIKDKTIPFKEKYDYLLNKKNLISIFFNYLEAETIPYDEKALTLFYLTGSG